MYVWRGLGFKGFAGRAVIPLVGIIGAWKGTMIGFNKLREEYYASDRKELVEHYEKLYGKQFLLNVLSPSFRF